MKSRNLILIVLFALLITPVLAVAPTSNFYLVPTDKMVYSMVPYDAMVYQDGTYTIAVNRTGGIINATLISANIDDVPIQAAITSGNRVYIQGNHSYNIASKITVHTGSFIEGDGIKTALWALMNDDMFYGSATNEVTFRDIYINMNNKNGSAIHLVGTSNNNFGHLLDDVIVISSNTNGVSIEDAQTIRISNSIFEACTISGLYLHNVAHGFVTNTLAEGNGIAISLNGSAYNTIQSGEFNSNIGINLVNSQQNVISGIHVFGYPGNITGVYIGANSFRNVVSANSFYIYGTNTFGINSLGYQNIFIGNNIQGSDDSTGNRLIKGIVPGASDKIIGNTFDFCADAVDSASYNIISENSILHSQYGIVNVGTGIVVSNNIFDTVGAPFINYGTISGEGAVSVADGGTINHNLGYAPNWCSASPTVSNTTVSTESISATTFNVAIKNSLTGAPGTTQTIVWRCGL